LQRQFRHYKDRIEAGVYDTNRHIVFIDFKDDGSVASFIDEYQMKRFDGSAFSQYRLMVSLL